MADYIKREDAIRSIADHDEFKGERWIKEAWADYMIEDAKPADVEPVRHGYWKQDRGGKVSANCSICDSWMPFRMLPYCPYCGAKMDGEEDV